MTTTEVYANDAQAIVTSGGTTAPSSGTVETWTVTVQIPFQNAVTSITQFHVADTASGKITEKILVTNGTGSAGTQTWTVTRGAEGTTPLAHAAGFIVQQVVTAALFPAFMNTDWLNAVTQYGADPTATNDSTTAIQNALNAAQLGQAVFLFRGTYKTTSTLTIPNGVKLLSEVRSFAVPTGNYGNGGLPLTGAIIQPSVSFSGTAIISLGNVPVTQAGGQSLTGITIDGSQLPSSSAIAGIQAVGWVAGVTLREVLVWSGPGSGQMLGPGIDARADGSGHAPDFWDVAFCKVSAINGIGINTAGLADSYFFNTESTGNAGDQWRITNGGNSRYIGCKAENGAGFGWNLIGQSGFTGSLYFNTCTSSGNSSGGFSVSSTGTGLYRLNGVNATDTTPYTFSGSNTVQFTSNPAVAPVDLGLLGMAFDPVMVQGNADTINSGTPQLIKIPVRENIMVSKVRIYVIAGGSCTTGQCFAGLYSPAGTKIGGSADQAATWQATTNNPVDMTLTSGPFPVSPPFAWAMVLWNGTTTTFGRGFNVNATLANGNLSASVARFAHNGSTQTTLPLSITPSSNVIDNHPLFAALL